MEESMRETIFDTRLLKDGHLFCPKEFAKINAKFKVIVSFPDEDVTESEIECASVTDISNDFLSKEEVKYYLQLGENNEV